MAALNAAYAAGDAEAIARMIDGEAARPEAIIGDDIASRLVRVLRKLAQVRSRLAELAQMGEALQVDPLITLFAQCRDPWQSGEDPLAEDEASLRTRIADAQAPWQAGQNLRRDVPDSSWLSQSWQPSVISLDASA
jgi:hypothetical protein